MMRIAVLSHCRVPTLPTGGNGLGRFAYEIAYQLRSEDTAVTLFAGAGSQAPFQMPLKIHTDENERALELADCKDYDVYLDFSHTHALSHRWPHMPVINWITDTEAIFQPPCCIVGNEWQREQLPRPNECKLIRAGVDVRNIPFRDKPDDPKYLAFCAKLHPAKGYDLAIETAHRAGFPLRLVGQKYVSHDIPGWEGEITDNDALWRFLGGAYALLAPSRLDAGGLVVLQAAAAGTPVITLDCTGTQYHVEHCVTGFVCADVDEMVEAVQDAHILDRSVVSQWIADHHSMDGMISELERLCKAVASGERW